MNNMPRQKLCELMADSSYGHAIYKDLQQCEGLLRDFCGQYRAEVFALVTALKEGVPKELLKSSQKNIPKEMILARLSKRLSDLGLSKKSSHWAVNSWALALEIGCELEESETVESQQKEPLKIWQEKLKELEEKLDTQKQEQERIEEKAGKFKSTLIATTITALIVTGVGVFFYHSEIEQRNTQLYNLKQKNNKLESKLEHIETALGQGFDENFGKSESGRKLYFRNDCSKTIQFAMRYKQPSGNWKTDGWWEFDPNQYSRLISGEDDVSVRLSSPLIYFYSEAAENKSVGWRGEESILFEGRDLQMRIMIVFPDSYGNYMLSLPCE